MRIAPEVCSGRENVSPKGNPSDPPLTSEPLKPRAGGKKWFDERRTRPSGWNAPPTRRARAPGSRETRAVGRDEGVPGAREGARASRGRGTATPARHRAGIFDAARAVDAFQKPDDDGAGVEEVMPSDPAREGAEPRAGSGIRDAGAGMPSMVRRGGFFGRSRARAPGFRRAGVVRVSPGRRHGVKREPTVL